MSTINVDNYGNLAGSASVPASAVLEGTTKAALVYDQTGPTTEKSYNISSVTDTSTGLFTINFTNSFDSANYYTSGTAKHTTRTMIFAENDATNPTASDFTAEVNSDVGSSTDTRSTSKFTGDLA